MLAGLLKGPSYFDPDRHPERAKGRLAYVLGRMQEDGVISAEQKEHALAAVPKVTTFARPHRDSGFQFVDFVAREARLDGIESLTAQSYTVHTTINAQLQRDTEAALQGGLAQYEMSSGQIVWHGPEANVADAAQKLAGDNRAGMPALQLPDRQIWQLVAYIRHLPRVAPLSLGQSAAATIPPSALYAGSASCQKMSRGYLCALEQIAHGECRARSTPASGCDHPGFVETRSARPLFQG